MKMEHTTQKIK